MSLIDAMMDTFVFMNKTKVPDGQGGSTTTYEEGAEIKIALVTNTSDFELIADAIREKSTYTMVMKKDDALEANDVVKRSSDGLTFKVKSDPKDGAFPNVASEMLRDYVKVSAERWDIPT